MKALPITPGWRLSRPTGRWHLFVYGRARDTLTQDLPRTFPARQSAEASQAVARLGHLPPDRALFVRQHPRAIEAGAFHNDVVMVGDGTRLLVHEYGLVEQEAVLQALRRHLPRLRVYQVPQRALSLRQAVTSYLFNSQLLHTPQGAVLLAPGTAAQGRRPKSYDVCWTTVLWITSFFRISIRAWRVGGGQPVCACASPDPRRTGHPGSGCPAR